MRFSWSNKKCNIEYSAWSLNHNISKLCAHCSSVIVNVSSSSNIESSIVSLGHNITQFNSFVSIFIWKVRLKILETDLNIVSVSHCFESIVEVNVFVSSIVLRGNCDSVSWSVCFECVSDVNVLFLSWNDINNWTWNNIWFSGVHYKINYII